MPGKIGTLKCSAPQILLDEIQIVFFYMQKQISRTQINFSRTLLINFTSQDFNANSPYCLPCISYFVLAFNIPEQVAFFQDFPVLENFQVLQGRPYQPCCTDQLKSRSTQRCESLTRATRDNSGSEKFQSQQVKEEIWGKSPFPPSLAKIRERNSAEFRNAEKFIDRHQCVHKLTIF